MDIKTILISYLITNAICAGVIWALYSQNRKHFNGLELWLTAYLMQFAGLILISMRDYLPELISVIAGNGIFIGGTILLYVGVEHFLGKRSNQAHNYILLTLFVAAHAYFLVVRPDMTARSINLSLALVALCAQFVWLIFRRTDVKLRPAVRGVGFVFAVYGLVSLIRIGVNAVMPLNEDFFQLGLFDIGVILTYQMLFIALTFSLFMMVNRRLLMELGEDITRRKQAEEALRMNEERYRNFVAQSFEAISRTEFDHPVDITLPVEEQIDLIYENAFIVECNQAMADMYHAPSPEAFVGMRLIDAHGGKDDPINRETFRKLIMNGYKSISDETKEYTLDGKPIWFLNNTIGIVENGYLVRLWGTAIEITEQKRMEAALRASEASMRSLIENVRDVFARYDLNLRYQYISPMVQKYLDATPESFIGKTHHEAGFPEDKAEFFDASLRKVIETKNPIDVEFSLQGRDGETIQQTRVYPEFDEKGKVVSVVTVTSDITKRRRIEEALVRSQQMYQDLVERQGVGVYRIRVQKYFSWGEPEQAHYEYEFVNDEYCRLTGASREEHFADPTLTLKLIHPEDYPSFAKKNEEVDITNEPFVWEGRMIVRGEIRWMHYESRSRHFPDIGEVWTGILMDITERKQADEKLRESEERFRQVIISAPDVVFVVDEEGKITFANMEATNLLGYAPDEFIGMAVEKLMPENIREDHIANRTKYMRDPHTRLMGAHLNLLATHKDGNEIPVDIKISPVNIDGKTHIVAFMRDITMRKQAEEKLRESEEKYRLIVETAHEGIWVLDTDGKTSYANTRMAEMLGYKIEELIGHSLFEFMDDDARKEAEQMLERRRKGVAEQHEFRFRRKDGSPFWALLSTNAIIDSDGKFIGALGMITDVTERKQAEEKLIKAKEEAEEGEARFRKSLEFSPTPMALADYTGKLIFLNQNFIDTYGYTLQDIPTIDQWMLQAYPDTEYRNRYLQLWGQDTEYAIKNNTTTPLRECLVRCKSGEVKTVAILAFFEKDLIIGHFLDISERKQAEEALRLEQAFVNNALDNQQDTFFLFDFTSGKALRWNRAFREISGYSDEEIATLPAPVSYYSTEDLAREYDVIQRIMQGEPASIVMDLICKDGNKITTEYQAAPLKDENGEYRYIIAIGRDITERMRAEGELRNSNETLKIQFNEINTLKESLQEQAIRDPLTRLHNRRYLDETLEHEIARAKRENYPISIMLIDIDRFKNFNDTYGHSAGDEVLKSLSRLLVDSIRQGDIACRYGGEEFLIVMIGAHETDVERRAEGICRDFSKLRIRFGKQELSATVSIGVAIYPRHGTVIQQVIGAADAAMYQAKQAGRNQVQVWEAGGQPSGVRSRI